MKRPTTLPTLALWFILAAMLASMFSYHHWTRSKPGERGVIKWDVISYYAYLPATFIYGDVELGFLDNPPEGFKNDNKFWYYTLDNGNKLIQTSMGLSILYSPFFFIAHYLAPYFDQTPDGYSSIYQLFLVLSSLFYVMIGLYMLKRTLLRFFTQQATALTLILVGLGTNLYFYTVHEGPMSHGYNFALITIFLYLVIRWYEEPSERRSIFLGLVYGLIVLVRPSNIIVGIVFLGWGVSGLDGLKSRPGFLLKRIKYLLLMMVFFVIVWIPQMLYWKAVTGSLLFNSYGPSGSSFFFGSPHIFHLLFSFRKGWFIYTPVMLAATFGILFMGKRCKEGRWPISLLLVIQIYILASWWSWWNGGSFGLRSFVDIYGMMALPLAALIDTSLRSRKIVSILTLAVLGLFLYMNQFQTIQYTKGFIHHTGMTREAYRLNFLKFKGDGNVWNMLSIPDPELARLGIYVNYYTGDDNSTLRAMDPEEGMERIRTEIQLNHKVRKQIGKHARRSGESYYDVFDKVVERVYTYKMSN
jgi:hypothetical protein